MQRHLEDERDRLLAREQAARAEAEALTVRLPRVTPAAAERGPAPLAASDRVPRRILVIEDNADAREMVCILLSLAGHEVHEAGDGPAGIALAEAVCPDVALIDVGLPGVDGYEVARRIRCGGRGASMRLVAITGYGQVEDVQRALGAGFDAHLTKPMAPDALSAAVTAVGRQSRPPHR